MADHDGDDEAAISALEKMLGGPMRSPSALEMASEFRPTDASLRTAESRVTEQRQTEQKTSETQKRSLASATQKRSESSSKSPLWRQSELENFFGENDADVKELSEEAGSYNRQADLEDYFVGDVDAVHFRGRGVSDSESEDGTRPLRMVMPEEGLSGEGSNALPSNSAGKKYTIGSAHRRLATPARLQKPGCCTDWCCLVIFVLFMVGTGLICGFVVYERRDLWRPRDDMGRLCNTSTHILYQGKCVMKRSQRVDPTVPILEECPEMKSQEKLGDVQSQYNNTRVKVTVPARYIPVFNQCFELRVKPREICVLRPQYCDQVSVGNDEYIGCELDETSVSSETDRTALQNFRLVVAPAKRTLLDIQVYHNNKAPFYRTQYKYGRGGYILGLEMYNADVIRYQSLFPPERFNRKGQRTWSTQLLGDWERRQRRRIAKNRWWTIDRRRKYCEYVKREDGWDSDDLLHPQDSAYLAGFAAQVRQSGTAFGFRMYDALRLEYTTILVCGVGVSILLSLILMKLIPCCLEGFVWTIYILFIVGILFGDLILLTKSGWFWPIFGVHNSNFSFDENGGDDENDSPSNGGITASAKTHSQELDIDDDTTATEIAMAYVRAMTSASSYSSSLVGGSAEPFRKDALMYYPDRATQWRVTTVIVLCLSFVVLALLIVMQRKILAACGFLKLAVAMLLRMPGLFWLALLALLWNVCITGLTLLVLSILWSLNAGNLSNLWWVSEYCEWYHRRDADTSGTGEFLASVAVGTCADQGRWLTFILVLFGSLWALAYFVGVIRCTTAVCISRWYSVDD